MAYIEEFQNDDNFIDHDDNADVPPTGRSDIFKVCKMMEIINFIILI